MKIEVTEYTKKENLGNLRALVSVCVGRVIIHDCRIVQVKNQRPLVQPPQKTWIKDGKQCFGGPLVQFEEADWCAIQRVILSRYATETGVFVP